MKKQLLIAAAVLGSITFASAQKTSIAFDATNFVTEQTFNFGKQSGDDLDIDIVTAVSGPISTITAGQTAEARDNNAWIGVLCGAKTDDNSATFTFTIESDGATVPVDITIRAQKRGGNSALVTPSIDATAFPQVTLGSVALIDENDPGTDISNHDIVLTNITIPSTGVVISISLDDLDHGLVTLDTNRPVFRFSTIKIQANDPLSIDSDFESTEETSLFPNPVTDSFQLSSNQSGEIVQIYSIGGSLLKTFSAQESYDISDLVSGVYFVNTGSKTIKIVKK